MTTDNEIDAMVTEFDDFCDSITNPCCPVDAPRCPEYWQCFNDAGIGIPRPDRLCGKGGDHQ